MAKRFHPVALALSSLLAAACSSSQPSPGDKKLAAYHDAGVEAIHRREYGEALRNLLEANRLGPRSAPIWSDLGIAYAGQGEKSKAEECWKKALQLDPGYHDARLNLGKLYAREKHFAEAEKQLKEATKDLAYRHRADAAYELAKLYLARSQPLLAEQQLKVATRENPSLCAAWMRLGTLQKERGDFAEAARSLKGSVMGVCYKNPKAHYEIANLLIRSNQIPQAKTKLLEIIQLFPTSEWAARSEETLNSIR